MSSCCGKDKAVPLVQKSEEVKGCSTQQGASETNTEASNSCCGSENRRFDYLLWIPMAVVVFFYPMSWWFTKGYFADFSAAVFDLMNSMAWGLMFGILMVAILAKVPREFVMSILGTKQGIRGLLRATGAGLLLDLCNHGILLVGAKLYERGASAGQVMAFLIASPWNSLSLTLILIALIGFFWTLVFVLLSALVALISGLIFDRLVNKGVLPQNPNSHQLPENFQFWPEAKRRLSQLELSKGDVLAFLIDGIKESRMVIRWLLIGVILAALIRVFVPEDVFGTYFGPTLLGLGVTLGVATVLEVCSEGSTPIAADIFSRASAPGNSFAFLMTGAATDYTEVMVIKETTRSWKMALFLPLVTVPQVVVLAIILNFAA